MVRSRVCSSGKVTQFNRRVSQQIGVLKWLWNGTQFKGPIERLRADHNGLVCIATSNKCQKHKDKEV